MPALGSRLRNCGTTGLIFAVSALLSLHLWFSFLPLVRNFWSFSNRSNFPVAYWKHRLLGMLTVQSLYLIAILALAFALGLFISGRMAVTGRRQIGGALLAGLLFVVAICGFSALTDYLRERTDWISISAYGGVLISLFFAGLAGWAIRLGEVRVSLN
jgi:hypothetical protein